jgi:catechol 2,3-dioxygenase-like lactoylglutathione lyase family enzyme
MLNSYDAVPMVAVKDLAIARRFYEQTLGLTVTGAEGDQVLQLKTGKTTFVIYRSDFAGTNKATALTWDVGGELVKLVAGLRQKDVPFMHYDLPGLTRDGDIHVGAGRKLAWIKDPDGNILGLMGS